MCQFWHKHIPQQQTIDTIPRDYILSTGRHISLAVGMKIFSTDIEELTRKTGNFKQFPIFLNMLESAITKVTTASTC